MSVDKKIDTKPQLKMGDLMLILGMYFNEVI
jgi:hypothetical protein